MCATHRVAETEVHTPFERFRNLAPRMVAVPKREADEIAEQEKTVSRAETE